MTTKLAGTVALVTGGSGGIGLGIAKRFAQEGARVFITGRRQSQLDDAVNSISGDAAGIQGDTSNLDLWMVESLRSEYLGRFHSDSPVGGDLHDKPVNHGSVALSRTRSSALISRRVSSSCRSARARTHTHNPSIGNS
jgi:NAD(P)-dependent dehydrogenase (short-subunit alcohol dehydrogenase family)